jgi:SagB-type dehydrogenase family enzyme
VPGNDLIGYHRRTKHSIESVRRAGHVLDWANEPSRFKEYVGIEPIPLPRPERSDVPCHRAVRSSWRCDGRNDVDRGGLSHLLFHAAGVVREVPGPGGSLHFRTYAAAGALYPVEVYVVAGAVTGVEAGVYHYGPREHGIRALRTGDFRGSLGLAGEQPGQATLVFTGVPWRTSWKYEARGLRHLYWDAGMMLANLLASAAALRVRAKVILGFVDRAVDGVVGIDGRSEFALAMVVLGSDEAPPEVEVLPLELQVARMSMRPRNDPIIERAREDIALGSEDEVAGFREAEASGQLEEGAGQRFEVPVNEAGLSVDSLEEVVLRRGSSRRLARQSFPAGEYALLLDQALGGLPRDWLTSPIEARLTANALDGLERGAYAYSGSGRFDRVRAGDLRKQAAFLCLEQRLGADAAATTFLMADVEEAVRRLGGRGYAAAQLEAAVAAGRLYLGAYAQCLGASGITFYDDEVRRFLDTSWEPMLAVVMGPEGRRASIRRCREERIP